MHFAKHFYHFSCHPLWVEGCWLNPLAPQLECADSLFSWHPLLLASLCLFSVAIDCRKQPHCLFPRRSVATRRKGWSLDLTHLEDLPPSISLWHRFLDISGSFPNQPVLSLPKARIVRSLAAPLVPILIWEVLALLIYWDLREPVTNWSLHSLFIQGHFPHSALSLPLFHGLITSLLRT